MVFDMNMMTKDGKKMMYLISIGVNKDCEDYDTIWAELERRMGAVSIPIVRVDWPLYNDDKKAYDFSDCLFYAQTFETGMGFVSSVMKDHELRTNLDFCNFYNGDAYKKDIKRYDAEDVIKTAQKCIARYKPNEVWYFFSNLSQNVLRLEPGYLPASVLIPRFSAARFASIR